MRFMKTRMILLAVFAACLCAIADEPGAGLDIYLVRHAETMGNVTGDYTEENQRTFSPKGLEQVAGIAEKLTPYHFDHIIVSPTYRTRQTILPYLRANGLTAEIWPEIEECCCDVRGNAPPAETIPTGEPIIIEEDEALYFRVRDEDSRMRFAPTTEEHGIAQMKLAGERILKHYGQSGKSVLVVTHSCTGSRIMEVLLGVKPAGRFAPANAAVTHLRQNPDGTVRLLQFNDEPYEQRYFWKLAEDRDPVPGEPLALLLVPRFFAQQNAEGCTVSWRLTDHHRNFVATGQETFMPAAIAEDGVLRIEVPTLSAEYGTTWSLASTLTAGGKAVQKWKFDILFPSYLSLAGTWRIKDGDDPLWVSPRFDDRSWAATKVPGGWEADALPGYDGTAWYRYTFARPDEAIARWGDVPLAIAFGAADDADETYLNGKLIGQSGIFPPDKVTAWDRPRVYEIGPGQLLGTNVLAVRISDWGGGGGIWKGPVAIGPAAELRDMFAIEP